MTKLWLGLDVGTTAVKAAAYLPDGTQVALADAPNAVVQRAGGISEQDMSQVWDTVCAVLRDLTAQCAGHTFESLGVAAQGDGLWCMTKEGVPSGPAMLWNDTRTAEDLAQLVASGATGAVGQGCHTSLWTGTSGMLWRWLRENRTEVVQKTDYAFTCADWIGYCLTGQVATDFSDASIPFLKFADRSYAPDQIRALGCEDIADKLLEPSRADTILGRLSQEAAARSRLPEGLSVSVGTLDLSAMLVGMGMDQPGQTMMIMGTTAVVNILTDHVAPTDAPVGASVLHPTSDAIIRVLAPTTGAAAFDWFAGLHPNSLAGASAGETAQRLNDMVRDVPAGANGVTFLPYLNGERAPFVAPDLRAMFHGLSAMTTTGEMGRAVLEGAALSLRHCFEQEGGLPTAPVQLTGGGAKNPLWCQIIADVMKQSVSVSTAVDHGLWGAAALGASASGLGEAITLAKRREDTHATYLPNRANDYDAVFTRYQAISQSHRALQETLSNLRKETR